MTNASLGTVSVRIDGQDVGLADVMGKINQQMQQNARVTLAAGEALDKQSSYAERARNASLSYVNALVRQRTAAGDLSGAMAILNQNADEFAGGITSAARYAALYQQTATQATSQTVAYRSELAKAAVGTNEFADRLDELRATVAGMEKGTAQYARALANVAALENRHAAAVARSQQATQQAAAAQQRAVAALIQHAQAASRATAATGNYAQAADQLQRELQQLVAVHGAAITGTTQYLNAQTQLANTTRRAQQQQQGFAGTILEVVRGLGSISASAYVVQAAFSSLAATMVQTITAGNELEKFTATVEALSGTTGRFEQVMDSARRQQSLYGGSIRNNIEDLQGFIFTSNQTGIAVEDLANVARRLAIIDPVQGMRGAGVALREFFSGDITSLSRRFEISRSTLRGMDDLASQADKLKALEQVLTDMGIGMDLLQSQAQLTAVDYDRLAGSFEDATAALGRLLAESNKPLAVGAEQVFGAVANFFIDRAEDMKARTEQLTSVNNTAARSVIEAGGAYEQYTQRISQARFTMGEFEKSFNVFTETQFGVISALMNTGSSFDEAAQFARTYGVSLEDIANRSRNVDVAQFGNTKSAGELYLFIQKNIEAYTNIRIPIMNYVDAMNAGKVTELEAYRAIMLLIEAEQMRLASLVSTTSAYVAARDAVQNFSEAAKEEAKTTAIVSAQTELLSAAQKTLTSIADLAAQGLITTGNAAAIMGSMFGIAEADALTLIGALKQVYAWQGMISTQKVIAETPGGEDAFASLIQAYDDLGDAAPDWQTIAKDIGNWADNVKDAAGATIDAAEAQEEYEFSLLNTAQQIVSLQAKLGTLNKGQKEYWETLADIKKLQEKKPGGGGGGAPATQEVSDLQKLLYALSDIRDDYYKDQVAAEREYQQKVLDIQKEFAKKQKEAESTNETDKRRSRSSFYASLTDLEGMDTPAFAAQYEQIFAEAQRIAQEGNAVLSKEFLNLRQNQLQEMIDLEKQMQGIRTDERMTPEAKAARLEYLAGVKKLMEDAQAEELKQLMAGGDKNQTELADRLGEEAKAYSDQTQKIATAAKDQADAKITAAERSKKVTGEENELLQKQLDLYFQIYQLAGRKVAGATVGITTESVPPALASGVPTAPTPMAYPEPLKIDTSNVVIQTPQPAAVAPSNMAQDAAPIVALSEVHDRLLNATVNTVGARLENKLAEVISELGRVDENIVGAIRNIKLPSPQIVSR